VAAREAAFGEGRSDFALRDRDGGRTFLEVKSCTLVERRHGRFPDAPTTRGARHCREAAEHVRRGGRAAILFCVQRSDCDVVSPNRLTDPDFGRALDEAADAGVVVSAVRCRVGPRMMMVDREIRVAL
jgi:sugar fermentation stimulation protein A